MQELEKKFYEYFMSEYFNPKEPEKIAHDLAKIAEKKMKEGVLVNFDVKKGELTINHKTELQKENEKLKKQNKLMNCTINEMGYEIECHKKQIEDNK